MKLSILIPVKNGSKEIRRLLDSIKAQGYKDYEVVISDGNSTDNTLEIIRSYGFNAIESSDRSIVEGINNCIDKSTGDVLTFIGHDDEFAPDAFQRVVDYYAFNNDKMWLYAPVFCYHEGKGLFTVLGTKPVTSWVDIYKMFERNHIPGIGVFVRRELVNKLGFYEDTFPHTNDYDCFCKYMYHEVIPGWIDRPLAIHHRRDDSISMDTMAEIEFKLVTAKWMKRLNESTDCVRYFPEPDR